MIDQAWRLVDLSGIQPVATQAIYEAVAIARSKGIVPDTLIICWPETPLISVGYFQEVDKEVDTRYCEVKKIPVVRRILGGGAVYLDSNQVFYQLIGRRGGKVIPASVEAIYQRMLEAPVKTYREIGIHATYKPVNDIEIEGRKISGNGAAEVDGITILCGNIILDFNYDEMTRILKVPDEKFRDKLIKSLRERVTSIKRELGSVPSHQKTKELLVKHFEETLGVSFVRKPLTREEEKLLGKLTKEKYLSEKWTYENSNRYPSLSQTRMVKVSGRSTIGQGIYKSPGGLIRVTAEFVEGMVNDILISGDFTFIPSGKIAQLEKMLVNVKLDQRTLTNVIERFYEENKIESPGTTPRDFARAILIASGNQR
nr:lipoate protein ligase C-terminal domain-containing protein [Candidatus Njordarchaeota archaeon]